MKPSIHRRIRRRPVSRDIAAPKKENQQEQQFFGEKMHEPFFKPVVSMQQGVQRKCADCEKEDKVQRAPEKKEEEKVMKKEDKKEEKIQRVTDKKEEDKKVQKKEDKKEEEKVMKKEEKKEEEKIHKKETSVATTNTSATASNYIGSIDGRGQGMDAGVQSFYESRMGADFSDVKIHTGKEAAESAKDINAQAYAYDNHIVFSQGKYQPQTSEGKHLLAHELTHVMQQDRKPGNRISRKTESGFDIRGIYPDAASYPSTIFYEMGSAMIPSSEWHKVGDIAHDFAGKPITITGTASEEGGDVSNTSLINSRIGGVSHVLKNAGHNKKHSKNPRLSDTSGNKDYRQARNVEVKETLAPLPPGGEPPSSVDPCDKTINPDADISPCNLSVINAWPIGIKWIINALSKLNSPDIATIDQTATLFPGVPVKTVTANISNLLGQYIYTLFHHACHSTCDPACSRPARMDPDTGNMTVCPDFINEPSDNERAETLIHESLHATPGVKSDDIAYLTTRLITSLTGPEALKNTDSYVLLIFSLNGMAPSSVPPADTFDGTMTAPEQRKAQDALAFLEQWLLWSQYDTSLLYDAINTNIGRAGGWDTANDDMAMLMHNISTFFLLTDPGSSSPFPNSPINEDKAKMAGMYDRYNRMMYAVYQKNLDVHKSGISKWEKGPGAKIDLAEPFFAFGKEDAVKFIFALLVRADGTVPSGLVDAYIQGGNAFRKHWNMGP